MTLRLTAASLALAASALLTPAIASADPFSQRDFPCQEDEVLGYAPQFGPDRVGCIHIEEFTGPNVVDHSATWTWGDDNGYDAGYEDDARVDWIIDTNEGRG
jgi:hypothetical protein